MVTALIKTASKSAAPGQYLGYGLQDVRLCHHLLKSPAGCSVSLEFIEDTAIHRSDGTMLLEQAKSALSGNPVRDTSVELWKCFANWARLCSDGKVNAVSTQFHLYACPPKEGELVQFLHAASTRTEAATLLTKITKKVTPGNKLKGCNPLITEFLAAGAETCQQIILNFRLIMEVDPLEPIREVLRFSVLEVAVDDFCAHAIGTAKNQIAAHIRAGETPMIDATEFRKRLQAFIRKHGALGFLVPTTGQPSDVQIGTMLAATPVFVQQLIKVKTAQELVVRAVSDFLRSDADRTLWAAEGRIVEESLHELHDGLDAHFRIMRDEVEDLFSAKDAETRGRQVYRRCITHQVPLEGRSVPSYFIPGTYNMLADGAQVGWHPQYADFFPRE